MRSASSSRLRVRRRKAPAIAGKTFPDNGEALSPDDNLETQKQSGVHSAQTPYGRRLETEPPYPPPLEPIDHDQLLNIDNDVQHMSQLVTGDRTHSNYNYAMHETLPDLGLGNEDGYRRPAYLLSETTQEFMQERALGIPSITDTRHEIGDTEAQQSTLKHVTNLEHEISSSVQDGPWSPVNLRKSASARSLERRYAGLVETLPAVGPFGPPGSGATYAVSKPFTESSLESLSQVTESSTESRPNVALSSTLPTSQGALVYEHERPIDKQATVDVRDSESVYSLESTVDHDRYIAAFAHRLLSDLTITTTTQDLSNLHPDFVEQTLKFFATRLHWESTNLFQRATSVVLHKKRG